MAFETWLMYLLAVLAVCITPGPNILLAMTHSVQYGLKRTSITALGCITATSSMALISATGLGALLLASENAFHLLKWMGGAYLCYMGISLWLKKESAFFDATCNTRPTIRLRRLYARGVMVSASNPKAIIFFGALFPLFINPDAPLAPQFAIMLTTFLVFSYGFIMGYAALTAKITPYLRTRRASKWFNRISGSLFMGLGLALATSEK